MDILAKLLVNPHLEIPLVVQIKEQLTWLIASGQLQTGDRLPSVRQAAKHLCVNLHTVRNAYLRLAAQGLVEIRQGAPARVLPYDPERLLLVGGQAPSHMIGVIVPNLENPIFTQLIRGIEEVARPEHTLLLVCDAHDEPEEALLFFRKLSEKGVDGILVSCFNIADHLPRTAWHDDTVQLIPFVTIDWPEAQGYCVLWDFEEGVRQAVAHLIADGHRHIGLISFAVDIPAVQQLHAGYRRALAEAGLTPASDLIASVYAFGADAGAKAARALLHLAHPPTAIFVMSDLLAFGAMDAIRSAGLRIPQDIALASGNDIPLAHLVAPPLTAVHQPAFEMGQEAMKMLRSLIAGERPPQRQVIFSPNLLVRHSCGLHG